MEAQSKYQDIYSKIKDLYEKKSLRAIFIRLGSGRSVQRDHVTEGRLYIGYGSGSEDILSKLCESKGSDEKIRNAFNGHELERLAPNALGKVFSDEGHTLWFTFIDGELYFGFIDQKENWNRFRDKDDKDWGSIRKLEGGRWLKEDKERNVINERSVSGKITKKRLYQGTVSEVEEKDVEYLVRRILCDPTQAKREAKESLEKLNASVEKLLPQLNEYDFETLVEMLFLAQGYEKVVKSAGNEKSFDLALSRPFDRSATQRCPTFVQIKAAIDDKTTVDKVFADFKSDKSFSGGYDRIGYLVYHSGKSPQDYMTENNEEQEPKLKLELIGPKEIARQCIEFGKVEWLLDKVV